MKLNTWAKIQTSAILKKISVAIVVVIAPMVVFIILWNQFLHIDALYSANKNTILSAIQTGDMILLEKVGSSYREDKAIFKYKLVDSVGNTLNAFERDALPFFELISVNKVRSSNGVNWGSLYIYWEPNMDFLLYFIIGTLLIVLVVGVLVFKSWRHFSQDLIGAIELMQASLGDKELPDFIKKIDELRLVFENIKRSQIMQLEANKIKLQSEGEKALIELSQKVAHDLRTPLSSLGLLIHPLAMESERKRLLELSMQRMRDICSELLNERKTNLNRKQTFASSIFEVVSELRIINPRKKIEIKISEDSINSISSDSTFKSVISNLINNSLDALSNDTGYVRIELLKLDSILTMKIKDNGKGIPPDVLAKLGSEPITFGKGSAGNGLGFYNAMKWVLSRNGALRIKSHLGIGSEICLELPLETSIN
ncbi:MAG: HAMP domain-containing histidine kinase [Bdellovibrionaceae bacterium]|nr:HAMP domain-containing histidine kinase [Pseudobdellovibrionaceae bacterium]